MASIEDGSYWIFHGVGSSQIDGGVLLRWMVDFYATWVINMRWNNARFWKAMEKIIVWCDWAVMTISGAFSQQLRRALLQFSIGVKVRRLCLKT